MNLNDYINNPTVLRSKYGARVRRIEPSYHDGEFQVWFDSNIPFTDGSGETEVSYYKWDGKWWQGEGSTHFDLELVSTPTTQLIYVESAGNYELEIADNKVKSIRKLPKVETKTVYMSLIDGRPTLWDNPKYDRKPFTITIVDGEITEVTSNA